MFRCCSYLRQGCHNSKFGIFELLVNRGADKSLAQPGMKQATFPTFYGTRKFITTFTRVSTPVPTIARSIHSSAHHTFDRRSLFPSWSG